MQTGYSIFMFIFAAALLLYALSLQSGDYNMVMKNYAVSPKDPKGYTKALGKTVALVAMAPVLSGIIALFIDIEKYPAPAIVALIGGAVIAIIIGVKFTKKYL